MGKPEKYEKKGKNMRLIHVSDSDRKMTSSWLTHIKNGMPLWYLSDWAYSNVHKHGWDTVPSSLTGSLWW